MANGLRFADVTGQFIGARDNAEQRAIRNELVRRQMAQQDAELQREDQTRNLIAEYTMPGSTAEARATNLNRLMAVNPDAAMRAQSFQNDQQSVIDAQTQRQAREIVGRMQWVQQSKNPAMALRVASRFSDGSDLMEFLAESGIIDPSDGIDDEEALRVAEYTMGQFAPRANLNNDVPAGFRQFDMMANAANLSPEERGNAARINLGLQGRAGQNRIVDVNGVPHVVVQDANGQAVRIPLSTLKDEIDASSQRRESDAAAASRGKTTTERWATQVDEGLAAADSIPVVSRGIELMKSGVETGGFDNLKLWASNVFGVTGADEAELSANLGKAVLSQLRSTFGAQFTEREGKRLESIEANFGKSTEGNIRLLEQALQIMQRTAQRGIRAATNLDDPESAAMIRDSMQFRLQFGDGQNAMPAGEIGAGSETVPEGIDPEDWMYMTPEERALWQ